MVTAGPYNVPDVDGVPAINFVSGASAGIELLNNDLASFPSPTQSPWGIYLNGAPVINADCVVSFSYKQEFALSDFPVEQGAFETYDKVQIPYDVRVRYAAGGNAANQAALLSSIAAIAPDLNLYSAVTPSASYTSCNVTHIDYNNDNKTSGLTIVDVWLFQIRTGSSTTGSNTAQPDGASPVSGGPVQATQPSASQSTAVNGGIVYAGPGSTDQYAPSN